MTGAVSSAAVRDYLRTVARDGEPVNYRDAAGALQLAPPHTIHQLALLLETLIEEDARAGRPLIASLVISKQRRGLPAPGFFARARQAGVYNGNDDSGADARAFHEREMARAIAFWGQQSG